jgi:hypothetical protein
MAVTSRTGVLDVERGARTTSGGQTGYMARPGESGRRYRPGENIRSQSRSGNGDQPISKTVMGNGELPPARVASDHPNSRVSRRPSGASRDEQRTARQRGVSLQQVSGPRAGPRARGAIVVSRDRRGELRHYPSEKRMRVDGATLVQAFQGFLSGTLSRVGLSAPRLVRRRMALEVRDAGPTLEAVSSWRVLTMPSTGVEVRRMLGGMADRMFEQLCFMAGTSGVAVKPGEAICVRRTARGFEFSPSTALLATLGPSLMDTASNDGTPPAIAQSARSASLSATGLLQHASGAARTSLN